MGLTEEPVFWKRFPPWSLALYKLSLETVWSVGKDQPGVTCLPQYLCSFLPFKGSGWAHTLLFFMKCKVIFLSIAFFTFDTKRSLYKKNGSQAINLTAAMRRKMEREREATPFS